MKQAVPFWGSFQTFSKKWDSEISVIFRILKKSTFRGFGYRKASKMRSNWYLLEALSGESEFLKNVLPPTRELDSRGCALPRIDQNNVFFERFEPRPSWNHIFACFL